MEPNKIEKYFSEEFTSLIEIRKDELIDKLKLNYALYDNIEEKNNVSLSFLEETRNKLSKYEGDIAMFLRFGINGKKLFYLRDVALGVNDFGEDDLEEDDLEEDDIGEDDLEALCYYFVSNNTPHNFWKKYESINDVDFNVIYKNHPSKKLLKKFIEALALVGLFEYLCLKRVYQKKEGFTQNLSTISSKQSIHLKFNGKRRLNLQERHHLINEYLKIDKRLFEIESKEKREELLAYILHCNPKNAQQVLNGTYDAKLRSSEISEYIKTIEKE